MVRKELDIQRTIAIVSEKRRISTVNNTFLII